jgi:hypothetical protein
MSPDNVPQAFEIDMTPDPPTMKALGEMRLGWVAALAEFLDNAFDHRAQRVAIDFRGRTVTIKDDGEGLDDLETLFKLGRHVAIRAQTLGRYGVGFKTAASWIGGTTRVATLSKGRIQFLTVKLATLKTWHPTAFQLDATPDACRTYDVGLPSGLTIQCSEHQHKLRDIDRVREELAYMFGPGVRQGRQIVLGVNGRLKPLAPWSFPEFEESFTQSADVNGRRYSLTAGVVRAGSPNPKPGFTIAYLHRVIVTTADPCRQYGAGRFFAFVELGPEWRLSTHKDSLSEQEYDELVDALALACQPLLVRAQEQAHDLSLQDLENSLTQLAGRVMSTARGGAQVRNIKEKRQPGTQHGTVEPTGDHAERQSTTHAQPGSRELQTRGSRTGIKIQLTHQGANAGLATVTLCNARQGDPSDRSDRVLLNRSNAFIEQLRQRHDRMGLITLALSHYALKLAAAPDDTRQQRLPFVESGDTVIRIYEQVMNLWTSRLGQEGLDRLLVAV